LVGETKKIGLLGLNSFLNFIIYQAKEKGIKTPGIFFFIRPRKEEIT